MEVRHKDLKIRRKFGEMTKENTAVNYRGFKKTE